MFELLAAVDSVVVVAVDVVGVTGSNKLEIPADLLKVGYGKVADMKSKQT